MVTVHTISGSTQGVRRDMSVFFRITTTVIIIIVINSVVEVAIIADSW